MGVSLNKFLYIYENNACVRQIEVEPGRHYLGLNERGQLQIAGAVEDHARTMARLELLKDGSAHLRVRRPEVELFVNERHRRESPLTPGDEILLNDFVMTWDERKNLKGYVFADQTNVPFLIVEDTPSREVRVSAVLPQRDWDELQIAHEAPDFKSEKVARQMSSLLLVSRQINSVTNQTELLETSIDYLFSVLMIDRAAILLHVPGQDDLEISRMAYRRRRPPDSIRLPSSITHQCVDRRAGILVTNAQEDPRYRSKPSVIQGAICSAMALPLIFEEELIGVLYVDSSNPAVEFSVDELKFMAIFANLATVAVRNVRRMDYLERKTTALQLVQPDDPFIVGKSRASMDVFRMLQRVAPSNVTVLLTGESGVGKEVAARRLHSMSPRQSEPFIAINCAAVPESLIESEMFGYSRGAFTGAEKDKPGKFELADGGTLFLDEVGELPLPFQAKLLRVLEGHGFERVGGTTTIRPQVRIVAATNSDLRQAVRNGSFREDLFYRLSVFPIHLPPLRARIDDIMELAHFFVTKFAEEMNVEALGFAPEAENLMKSYRWPGNVRELRNLVERLMILCDGGLVDEETLRESASIGFALHTDTVPPWSRELEPGEALNAATGTLWDKEAEAIRAALAAANGNKSKAARLLGISRHHLVYRVKKYELEDVK